jgi:hypothetical protein
MTGVKVLSTTLGTFLKNYGGVSYKKASIEEMKTTFCGLMDILNLDGPTKIIADKIKKSVSNTKTKEKILFKVSEEMLKLEGMGTE